MPARPDRARPSLIVFDLDGVLIDSEPLSNRVLADALAEAGYPITVEESTRRFTGLNFRDIAALIRAEGRAELAPDFGAMVRDRTIARFAAELKAIPHAAEVAAALGLARCVASSSPPQWIHAGLAATGMLALFDPHLFSAVEVPLGKPAPDLYRHALARMGATPVAAVAVEDSVPGVRSAAAAGLRVLGFAGGGHAQAPAYRAALIEAGAALVFDDMRALPELI